MRTGVRRCTFTAICSPGKTLTVLAAGNGHVTPEGIRAAAGAAQSSAKPNARTAHRCMAFVSAWAPHALTPPLRGRSAGGGASLRHATERPLTRSREARKDGMDQ